VDALRLPRSAGVAPLELVVNALSRQPSLLILDNFEHLVAAGVGLLSTLLARIPSLTVLVTSRQALNLTGEREFPVSPLPTPQPGEQEQPALPLSPSAEDGASALQPFSAEDGAFGEGRGHGWIGGGQAPALRRLVAPSELMAYPSVALFVDRAQAARRDFQ